MSGTFADRGSATGQPCGHDLDWWRWDEDTETFDQRVVVLKSRILVGSCGDVLDSVDVTLPPRVAP